MAREDIASLIPHQGAMCLWEEVIDWDREHVRLRSHGHRDPDHPLRHEGRLHAVHLCEYGAQAMAVHGGLLAGAAGEPVKPGMLVALRGVQLQAERIDDLAGALEVEAHCLLADGSGSQYGFVIRHGGVEIASGRAAVLYAQ
ncbi:MAG TPA: phosphotransferase [Lysobacter sp.]